MTVMKAQLPEPKHAFDKVQEREREKEREFIGNHDFP
jgi:hypothetical protein